MPSPQIVELETGIRRLCAPNRSPMTFHGTNTYFLGTRDIAVIDPGPADPGHLSRILSAGGTITHIFVTHAHLDHSPQARVLSQATGAKVYAFGPANAGRSPLMEALAESGLAGGGEGIDADFDPDITMRDGETVSGDDWSITALHTPGHLSNHLCFEANGAVFSGDHVMGWSSSLVSPPDGDLGAFMGSCRKLAERDDRVYYPGHGEPVTDPAARVAWLIDHRLSREAQILQALDDGQDTVAAITAAVYFDLAAKLVAAARRNVFAHLVDLWERKLITATPELSVGARFSLR